MEVTYRRNVGKSFMVISGICMQLDYQIEMCRRNRINPFLDFDAIVADGQLEYWYDITGKQSLKEYAKHKKLGYQELKKLLASIHAGIDAGGELSAERAVYSAVTGISVCFKSRQ